MKKKLFGIVLILSYKLNGVGLNVARAKPIPDYDYNIGSPTDKLIYNLGSQISVNQAKGSKINVTDSLGNTYTCSNQFLNQNAKYSNFNFDNGKIKLNTRFT